MGRLDFLHQSLPLMLAQPDSTCIVVDYSCPQRCGEWVKREHPAARVVSVPGKREFNFSQARNAGAQAAEAPWLCFVDVDILLHADFSARIVPDLRPGHAYQAVASPARGMTCGPFLILRDDFSRLGGYDEAIKGWGYEDNDIQSRIADLGLMRMGYPRELFDEIVHMDELRTENTEEKDKNLSQPINLCYSKIKRDLTRVLRRELPLAEREALHASIGGYVNQVRRKGKPVSFAISYKDEKTTAGFSMQRQIRVQLRP
jgi:glycosyltransferase involved in cell wall biosynthesis